MLYAQINGEMMKAASLNRTGCRKKNFTFSSQRGKIHKAVMELVGFIVVKANVREDEFPLVICEALENAVIHGNKEEPAKKVSAEIILTRKKVIIKIADEGRGFDYKNLPDPRDDLNFYKQHGRGLFIIRKFMDKVQFNKKGNEITMVKYLNREYPEIIGRKDHVESATCFER